MFAHRRISNRVLLCCQLGGRSRSVVGLIRSISKQCFGFGHGAWLWICPRLGRSWLVGLRLERIAARPPPWPWSVVSPPTTSIKMKRPHIGSAERDMVSKHRLSADGPLCLPEIFIPTRPGAHTSTPPNHLSQPASQPAAHPQRSPSRRTRPFRSRPSARSRRTSTRTRPRLRRRAFAGVPDSHASQSPFRQQPRRLRSDSAGTVAEDDAALRPIFEEIRAGGAPCWADRLPKSVSAGGLPLECYPGKDSACGFNFVWGVGMDPCTPTSFPGLVVGG